MSGPKIGTRAFNQSSRLKSGPSPFCASICRVRLSFYLWCTYLGLTLTLAVQQQDRPCHVEIERNHLTFSRSGIHDNIKWQFARNTQCPSFTPSSIIRIAAGACPCPSATLDILTPCASDRN